MDAMSEHGLTVGRDRVFYGDFWYTSGESLGDRIVKKGGKLPQAIACANDCMAIGLAKLLKPAGSGFLMILPSPVMIPRKREGIHLSPLLQ